MFLPFARTRAFVATILAIVVFLFTASDAFARPRFGGGFRGGGGFRSSGGFRGGGSIGSSRPSSGGGWFSRPSTPISAPTTNRSGGFRNGSTIGATAPAVAPSRPYGGGMNPSINTYPSAGRSTVIFHNSRPAYGGNIYVYDHRPWYTPMYLYHAPIYTPHGVIVHQAGFNWAGFFMTLLVIGLIIWGICALVSASRKEDVTTIRY